MLTTDKLSCNIIVNVLKAHGVKEVVISPGSRNAPLIVAFDNCSEMVRTVVVDERSAAFIALGKSLASCQPVALVCTSGTAVLNYSPAVAEAYYRMVPLIVISADRPMEWIDQDDSQTLRQFEALSHYVKRSYNIPAFVSEESLAWYTNRVVNDAMICATTGRTAPVHINVQLDEPLGQMADAPESHWSERTISSLAVENHIPLPVLQSLADTLGNEKVMIVGGFGAPSHELNKALEQIASHDNVAVFTESISNLCSPSFIGGIDATLSVMTDRLKNDMVPDMVITFGGALVSRMIKGYLRGFPVKRHLHVGRTERTIDCFKSLTETVDMDSTAFFSALSSVWTGSRKGEGSGYGTAWRDISRRASLLHDEYVDKAPWSDMKAMSYLFRNIPSGVSMHLSNGTTVRYSQLFPYNNGNRFDCNRGVSGIDGSTSTAVGASSVTSGPTMLITGDMSAQYDLTALAAPCIRQDFKMIVMCNGGGGIFRFVKSTASLPQREQYFAVNRHFPIDKLAEAYGFRYFEVRDENGLVSEYPRFLAADDAPAILAVHTDPEVSADVLKRYFEPKL